MGGIYYSFPFFPFSEIPLLRQSSSTLAAPSGALLLLVALQSREAARRAPLLSVQLNKVGHLFFGVFSVPFFRFATVDRLRNFLELWSRPASHRAC